MIKSIRSFVDGQRGFTLIEVLVALSILAITFGVLLPVFSGALQRQAIIADERTAALFAESKLSAIDAESPLIDGVSDGQFANGFSWNLRIAPYDVGRTNSLMTAKLLTLTVRWPATRGERSFEVKTIRLVGRE